MCHCEWLTLKQHSTGTKRNLVFTEEVVWTVEGLSGMQLAYLKLNGSRIEIVDGGNFKPLQNPPLIFKKLWQFQDMGISALKLRILTLY